MPTLSPRSRRLVAPLLTLGWLAPALLAVADDEKPAPPADAPVSYYKQVRPLLQAHCQGCHQPAKAGGDYVMTDFAKLLAGGETQVAAVVPGKPDESMLIDQITPDEKGEAVMPQGKPAGVRCVQLDELLRCRLFGQPERPAVCVSLRPSESMCGRSSQDAMRNLSNLEALTRPTASIQGTE